MEEIAEDAAAIDGVQSSGAMTLVDATGFADDEKSDEGIGKTVDGSFEAAEGGFEDSDGGQGVVDGGLESVDGSWEENDGGREVADQSEWEAIVEAVLFTMGDSVELRQLAAALGQDEGTALQIVRQLQGRYEIEKRGMQIVELDGNYQMCTKSKYYENLIRVASTPKRQALTEVMLETLSIVAYKQPITKLEISKIRGVSSDHAINRLIEYNLVYEVGRLDAPGRPMLFATTEEFLRRFGVGSTHELPSVDPVRMAEMRHQAENELGVFPEEEGEEEIDGIGEDGEMAPAPGLEAEIEEEIEAEIEEEIEAEIEEEIEAEIEAEIEEDNIEDGGWRQ
ncbi:MAG: SMC-Scp complex subunit ScpB [Lachnospiraceae bacterium]|nr:SMC-Scp complex subunit ScpB [Lachnospiraceae bacterium]